MLHITAPPTEAPWDKSLACADRHRRLSSSRLINIVFVTGAGRSGRPILERLLGEHLGWAPVGEFAYAWRRGVLDDQLCSCGAAFSRCDYWRRVFEIAEVSNGRVAGRFFDEFQARLLRTRSTLGLAFRELPADVLAYTDVLWQMYEAMGTV